MGLRSLGLLLKLLLDKWARSMTRLGSKGKNLMSLKLVRYEAMNTNLRTKYVDDVACALEKFKRGTRYNPDEETFTWTHADEMLDREMDIKAKTMPKLHMGLPLQEPKQQNASA